MRLTRLFAGATVIVAACLVIGSPSLAADVTHGISFTKGCESPTTIGAAYSCAYTIRNTVDDAQDTLTVSGLVDTVHTASGDVSSGQIFGELKLVTAAGSPTCPGAMGSGTAADPWRSPGLTSCTLPFGSRIDVLPFSFYTVQAADFELAGHQLTDSAELHWGDNCDDPAHTGNSNCNSTPPDVGAGSATTVMKLASATTTAIHNDGNHSAAVTTVALGSTVHDLVTVAGQPGSPVPSSFDLAPNPTPPPAFVTVPVNNVQIDWFTNGGCNAPAAASTTTRPLDANGQLDATGFSFTPTTVGAFAFQAHFLGDLNYNPSDGACEPLNVVDANIAISPPSATNAVGSNHVLTITVNALGGNLDAGPGTATASIVSGPGTFVGSPSCTYTGGGPSATCTVTIHSDDVGTTVVSATSNIPVTGVTIPRTTGTPANTASGGSGNASKSWVNANIQITPATASNPVNTNHVLTITVNALGGTIDAGSHTATASIVSGPGGFVGSPSCTYVGGGATAFCQVTITSSTPGTTVVQATSDIPVNGVVITRTTATAANTAAGGSGNASKVWFLPPDANIQISPPTATNAVGSNHVLTITVNAINGTLDAGPQTATASIVSGPGSFVGSPSCTYTGGGVTASCQVTITSNATGTTVVRATSNIPVNGTVIPRTTQTNPGPGGSGDANKTWVNANIQITPATATNPINTNHVLTITVNALNGTLASGTATASIVSGPGTFVGSPGCSYVGGGATASCTVTITSAVGGTTVVQATSSIGVIGVTIVRTTGTADNTAAGGSGNASKTWLPPQGIIAPTQTTCSDFTGGTAATLGQVNYSVSGGTIGQGINPGVFFFYTKITTTSPNQVVTVTETNTSTNNTPNFGILNGQAWLYPADCSSHTVGTVSGPNGENASFTVPVPGTYVIGIKYQTKTIAGAPAPAPANITFTFNTSLGGTTGGSVQLVKS